MRSTEAKARAKASRRWPPRRGITRRRATRPGATLLLSCFSDANPAGEDWRPAVSEETLREVLGGAGWDVESLEPATLPGELDGAPVEMAFWYLRAQRR
jgi:hypothetical protein